MEAENNFVEETSSKMKLPSMGAGEQHGGVEGIAWAGWCEHRADEFQASRLEQAVLEQVVVGLSLGDKKVAQFEVHSSSGAHSNPLSDCTNRGDNPMAARKNGKTLPVRSLHLLMW